MSVRAPFYFGLIALATLGAFGCASGAEEPATAASTSSAEGGVPRFEYDPTWPKTPLPNQWTFGELGGVHRQDQYHYSSPLYLPRGTRLQMEITYDNSAANRRNPHHPPKRVIFGPQSSDEMGDVWLQVLPRQPADVALLARDYAQRELTADIASGEMMMGGAPHDPSRHNFLGARYLQAGRVVDAVRHLREAVRLDPDHALAHSNLGDALLTLRRAAEGVAHLTRAARLSPRDDRIRFNLANALRATGRRDDAIREFQRAVELNPHFADAHNNLGVELAARQRLVRAIRHFERAVAIRPGYADARGNLGMALGRQRRPRGRHPSAPGGARPQAGFSGCRAEPGIAAAPAECAAEWRSQAAG